MPWPLNFPPDPQASGYTKGWLDTTLWQTLVDVFNEMGFVGNSHADLQDFIGIGSSALIWRVKGSFGGGWQSFQLRVELMAQNCIVPSLSDLTGIAYGPGDIYDNLTWKWGTGSTTRNILHSSNANVGDGTNWTRIYGTDPDNLSVGYGRMQVGDVICYYKEGVWKVAPWIAEFYRIKNLCYIGWGTVLGSEDSNGDTYLNLDNQYNFVAINGAAQSNTPEGLGFGQATPDLDATMAWNDLSTYYPLPETFRGKNWDKVNIAASRSQLIASGQAMRARVEGRRSTIVLHVNGHFDLYNTNSVQYSAKIYATKGLNCPSIIGAGLAFFPWDIEDNHGMTLPLYDDEKNFLLTTFPETLTNLQEIDYGIAPTTIVSQPATPSPGFSAQREGYQLKNPIAIINWDGPNGFTYLT